MSMRLIGAKEQRLIDLAWQERTGLPLLLLMEAAAAAVVRLCQAIAAERPGAEAPPVLVLCGRGQNGGDAFACARLLAAAGWPVRCCLLFPDAAMPNEAQSNKAALEKLGIPLLSPQEPLFKSLANGLIIDGIFGSGFAVGRGVPEVFIKVTDWTAEARSRGSKVIAIDVPSGVCSDTGQIAQAVVQADWTVTFVRPKIGLFTAPGCFYAGHVQTEPIGIAPGLVDSVLSDEPIISATDSTTVRAWCPFRPPDGHKGMFGRLLLIGGSDQMPGAVALSADAAARTGLGLLQLAVPRQIRDGLVLACPEALQLPVSPDGIAPDELMAAVQAATAVAIGPGLGSPDWLDGLLEELISTAASLVIDADALNALSRDPDRYWMLSRQRGSRCLPPAVLTPHPGEFRRLAADIGLADRRQAALKLAVRSGCVVVLKGAATIVAEPDGTCHINTTGQDGLARGGSGDVLTGLAGGLLAQGLPPGKAACAAVYFHGLAADLAAAACGRRAMLPRDVLAKLGSAWRQAGWEVNHG